MCHWALGESRTSQLVDVTLLLREKVKNWTFFEFASRPGCFFLSFFPSGNIALALSSKSSPAQNVSHKLYHTLYPYSVCT